MSHSFHYLIMAEQSMFHKELLSRLKDTGLTIGQPKILDYLKDHGGAGQKDIARGCHIEPGTLTTLLNRMEEAGACGTAHAERQPPQPICFSYRERAGTGQTGDGSILRNRRRSIPGYVKNRL